MICGVCCAEYGCDMYEDESSSESLDLCACGVLVMLSRAWSRALALVPYPYGAFAPPAYCVPVLLRRASLLLELPRAVADDGLGEIVLPGLVKLSPLTVTFEMRGAANVEIGLLKPAPLRLGDVGSSAWTFLSCLESVDGDVGLLGARRGRDSW